MAGGFGPTHIAVFDILEVVAQFGIHFLIFQLSNRKRILIITIHPLKIFQLKRMKKLLFSTVMAKWWKLDQQSRLPRYLLKH